MTDRRWILTRNNGATVIHSGDWLRRQSGALERSGLDGAVPCDYLKG